MGGGYRYHRYHEGSLAGHLGWAARGGVPQAVLYLGNMQVSQAG